jgi:hypothetical protein
MIRHTKVDRLDDLDDFWITDVSATGSINDSSIVKQSISLIKICLSGDKNLCFLVGDPDTAIEVDLSLALFEGDACLL